MSRAEDSPLPTVLNAYRRWRGLKLVALATELGVATSTAGRYVLPPTNGNHMRPNRHAAEKLRKWSRGDVHLGNYADPCTPAIIAGWRDVTPAPAEVAP